MILVPKDTEPSTFHIFIELRHSKLQSMMHQHLSVERTHWWCNRYRNGLVADKWIIWAYWKGILILFRIPRSRAGFQLQIWSHQWPWLYWWVSFENLYPASKREWYYSKRHLLSWCATNISRDNTGKWLVDRQYGLKWI